MASFPNAITTTETGDADFAGAMASLRAANPSARPNRRLLAFGDSRSDNAFSVSGTATRFNACGLMNFAKSKSLGAFDFQPSDNYGVAGSGSGTHLAQLEAALAVTPFPGWLWYHGPINDITNSVAYATIIANLTAVYDRAYLTGARLLVFTEAVYNSWSADQKRVAQKVNNWVRAQVATYPNLVVVDIERYFTDQTSATGVVMGGAAGSTTGLTRDGLHPGVRGAYLGGCLALDEITAVISRSLRPGAINAMDAYHAADNPQGNMLTNSILAGTTGLKIDPSNNANSAVAGDVADSWRVYKTNSVDITVTCSKSTADLYGKGSSPLVTQKIIVASGGTGQKVVTMRQDLLQSVLGYPVDSSIDFGIIVKVTKAVGLYGIVPTLINRNSSAATIITATGLYNDLATGFGFWPDVVDTFWIDTPRITTDAASYQFLNQINLYVDGATADIEIDIAVPLLRAA